MKPKRNKKNTGSTSSRRRSRKCRRRRRSRKFRSESVERMCVRSLLSVAFRCHCPHRSSYRSPLSVDTLGICERLPYERRVCVCYSCVLLLYFYFIFITFIRFVVHTIFLFFSCFSSSHPFGDFCSRNWLAHSSNLRAIISHTMNLTRYTHSHPHSQKKDSFFSFPSIPIMARHGCV